MASSSGLSPLTMQFALGVLRRRWKSALFCGVLLAAAAVGAVYLTFQPVYEVAAWLQISDKTPYIAFQSREDSRRFLETQMELMRSPLVLGPVVSQPEIAQVPEIRKQEAPIVWLASKIKASTVGQSELVKISFDSHSPAAAARVVNAVVDTYFDFRGRDNSEHMQRVIELLDEEKGRRMHEVDSMRDSIRELAKQVTGKDPFTPQSRKDLQGVHPLAVLQTKLINAEVERQILEARVKAFEESAANEQVEAPEARIDRAVEEDPRVQALKTALMQRKSRLQEYESTLKVGAKYPLCESLEKEIRRDEENLEEVRKELRKSLCQDFAEILKGERKVELAKLCSALDDARLLEQLLRERNESLLESTKEATGDTLQLEFKQAELTRAEKVLSLIAERAIQLRTERRAPARVVLLKKADELASPANTPYKWMSLAGLAGLCLPLLLMVGWEWLARRVSDSQQIEIHAHLPVLGEIARLPVRSALARRCLSRRAERELGLFEESIDGLRTCLVLSEPFHDIQVLAITSALNSEGKTSIALQLAVSIARASGQRVLLIDADMRSPDIHRLLQMRREPGLAEVLGHQCPVQESIVTDWNNSVHVMPAGKLATSPHKLVGNGAMKDMLNEVRPLYRYIIIDTPPILPASESLVLARAADACLICAMRDVSRIDLIRRSGDRLAAAGARTMGVVLNGVPISEYAHDYGKYYGYSQHEAAST